MSERSTPVKSFSLVRMSAALQSADSDLDFLVVEDGPFNAQRSRRAEMTRLWKLLGAYRVAKDFLVYTAEEIEKWRTAGNHVISHALKEGRVLYERA